MNDVQFNWKSFIILEQSVLGNKIESKVMCKRRASSLHVAQCYHPWRGKQCRSSGGIRNQTEVRGPPGCYDFLALALSTLKNIFKCESAKRANGLSAMEFLLSARIEVNSRQALFKRIIIHVLSLLRVKSKNMLFIFPWLLTLNVLGEFNRRRFNLLTN